MPEERRIAYLDAGAGLAGDMFLAAALDAGLDRAGLEEAVTSLELGQVGLRVEEVLRGRIRALHVRVIDESAGSTTTGEHHSARRLPEILSLLDRSGLPAEVVEPAARAFRRLAEVEGRIHGCPPEEVHFHEVGAVDSLVDIVGAFYARWALGLAEVYASPVPLGSGTIRTAHGLLPVPAPATLALLGGWPVIPGGPDGEAITPTGALILRELAGEWRPCPALRLKATGCGAGSRDDPGRANLFRLLIGDVPDSEADSGRTAGAQPLLAGAEDEEIVVLEANLDDMTAEWCGHLMEALFAAGARDAAVSPLQMKKGRPGWLVMAVATPAEAVGVARAFLRESTSLGLRYRRQRRVCLARRFIEVEVAGERVRVKVGELGDERLNLAPEFEDCRRAAAASGLPLKEVYLLAQAEARRQDTLRHGSELR